jgi:hypothetical protein
MTGILSPADVLGIANQTDPTRGAAEVGYTVGGVSYTVASFLDQIANGTETPITTPTGMEVVPVSAGDGLEGVTTDAIAQLAVNIKNSEAMVPITELLTILDFAQYNTGIINFTGDLYTNSNVQLPSTSGIWVFANNTTGAYSLNLQTGMRGAVKEVLTYAVYLDDWQGNQLLYTTPRTNLLMYSDAFSTAPWMTTDSTLTGGFAAPDGSTTAWELMDTTSDTTHGVSQEVTIISGATTTFSCFVAPAGLTEVYLSLATAGDGGYAIFNLSTGTVVSSANMGTGAGTIATIVMSEDGFYRCSVTTAVTGATSLTGYIETCYNGENTYAGTGTSGLYIFGAQIEEAATATSYIPTTAAAVTTTDYMITLTGLVTLAVPPIMGATLTWTGTYMDALDGIGTATAMLFGTGNGALTAFDLTPITGTGGTLAAVPQGQSLIAYSDGTNVVLASAAGAGNTLLKFDFIAAAGQTQVDVNYTPGNIVVSRNGSVLPASDYMATTGAYVTFVTPLNLNDEISVVTFAAFSTIGAISVYEFIATAGQATFTAGYTPGAVQVFRNGDLLLSTDYLATNGTSVTLITPCVATEEIKIISQQSATVANTVPITGGTYIGPVMFNAGIVFDDGSTMGSAAAGKNRIINGACTVAQRPALLYPMASGGYGGPDRFSSYNNEAAGGEFTQSQGTITYNEVTHYAVMQMVDTAIVSATTTNAWVGIQQPIEGYNAFDLLGKPVVVSFIFNTNVTGMYSVALRDGTTTNSYVSTFSATANTPVKVQIPITMLPTTLSVPNSNTVGLYINIGAINQGTYETSVLNEWQTGSYFAASGATNWGMAAGNFIALTNLQLEVGTEATPFEYRDFGAVLLQCLRYYQVPEASMVCGYGAAGTDVYVDFPLPVSMRVNPTIVIGTISYSNSTAYALAPLGTNAIRGQITITAAGPGYAYLTAGVTTLTAEL